MQLKDYVECAFGHDAEEQILKFLREKELAGCKDDRARWISLFEKCEGWRENFLLWEERTYIGGVHGWNLSLDICKLRLPRLELENWTEYLYRMTLLLVVSNMDDGERNSVIQNADRIGSLDYVCSDYYMNAGFTIMTREQWLDEMKYLRQESWSMYQKFPGNNPAYHRAMEKNYPRFDTALEYLEQNIKTCEVVRMNNYGGDESVWYFVRAQDCFYVMCVSDAM